MRQFNWFLGALCGFAATSLFWSAPAYAYKPGVVAVDGAELKEGPGPQFKTVSKLKQGTKFNAADTPKNGYYQVRVSTGTGWIIQAEISFQGAIGSVSKPKTQPKAEAAPMGPRILTNIIVGSAFFKPTSINDTFGADVLSNGVYFAIEGRYALKPLFGLDLRLDYMSRGAQGYDETTTNNYQLKITSLMLEAGLDFVVYQTPTLAAQPSQGGIAVKIKALGGMSLPSKFSVVASNKDAPNETAYQSNDIIATGLVDFQYWVSSKLGIYLEGGYRYVNAKSVSAATSGNGKDPFLQADGSLKSIDIALSGPVFGAGIGFKF